MRQPLIDQFDRTYREERGFVLRVVQRHGVPSDEAEDAVQEVFVVLYSRLHELEPGEGLRLWLRAVARRVCSNHRRGIARRRWAATPGSERVDPDSLVDPRQRPPDETLLQMQVRRMLTSAITRLDEEKRTVFVLSEIEGKTANEIAGLVRVSPNTVSSRLRAARQRLAHSLASAAP